MNHITDLLIDFFFLEFNLDLGSYGSIFTLPLCLSFVNYSTDITS